MHGLGDDVNNFFGDGSEASKFWQFREVKEWVDEEDAGMGRLKGGRKV